MISDKHSERDTGPACFLRLRNSYITRTTVYTYSQIHFLQYILNT